MNPEFSEHISGPNFWKSWQAASKLNRDDGYALAVQQEKQKPRRRRREPTIAFDTSTRHGPAAQPSAVFTRDAERMKLANQGFFSEFRGSVRTTPSKLGGTISSASRIDMQKVTLGGEMDKRRAEYTANAGPGSYAPKDGVGYGETKRKAPAFSFSSLRRGQQNLAVTPGPQAYNPGIPESAGARIGRAQRSSLFASSLGPGPAYFPRLPRSAPNATMGPPPVQLPEDRPGIPTAADGTALRAPTGFGFGDSLEEFVTCEEGLDGRDSTRANWEVVAALRATAARQMSRKRMLISNLRASKSCTGLAHAKQSQRFTAPTPPEGTWKSIGSRGQAPAAPSEAKSEHSVMEPTIDFDDDLSTASSGGSSVARPRAPLPNHTMYRGLQEDEEHRLHDLPEEADVMDAANERRRARDERRLGHPADEQRKLQRRTFRRHIGASELVADGQAAAVTHNGDSDSESVSSDSDSNSDSNSDSDNSTRDRDSSNDSGGLVDRSKGHKTGISNLTTNQTSSAAVRAVQRTLVPKRGAPMTKHWGVGAGVIRLVRVGSTAVTTAFDLTCSHCGKAVELVTRLQYLHKLNNATWKQHRGIAKVMSANDAVAIARTGALSPVEVARRRAIGVDAQESFGGAQQVLHGSKIRKPHHTKLDLTVRLSGFDGPRRAHIAHHHRAPLQAALGYTSQLRTEPSASSASSTRSRYAELEAGWVLFLPGCGYLCNEYCLKMFVAGNLPAGTGRSALTKKRNRRRKALLAAVKADRLDLVHEILSTGAHINVVDAESKTALHWACELKLHRMVDRLLAGSFNILAFHEAVAQNNAGLLTFNQLPDLSKRESTQGWTPLHTAAAAGDIGIVSKLIAAGAESQLPDRRGRVAHDVAASQPIYTMLASTTAVNDAADRLRQAQLLAHTHELEYRRAEQSLLMN